MDIGYDGNQILNTATLMAFAGSSTVYVTKIYNHVGSIDWVQSTQSLMPYIVKSGVLVTTASGFPTIQGAMEGRYLAGPGMFTPMAGQDFSITVVGQNNVQQLTPISNMFSPMVGISTSAGIATNSFNMRFGVRSSATGRNSSVELTTTTGSNEIAGNIVPLPKSTTCIMTTNCQNAALTGGPGAGSTIYVNRSPASTVNNASHSPANLTSATDIR
ncbi:hypothetical protein JTP94_14305, partial [Rhizobium lusitanum]|nr:hypothetical protein [Rhizobium lusitanum]